MAAEKTTFKGPWSPEMNHKLFLALIETSTVDYAAIAERLGEGHTKDTVYQRIYSFKNGRAKSFIATAPSSKGADTAAPAAKKPRAKKRKLADDAAADDAGVKKEGE